MSEEVSPVELDFFLRFPIKPHVTSPVDFLSNQSWGGICSLAGKDEFRNLDRDIETSPKRWKKIVELECPEREKFPQVSGFLPATERFRVRGCLFLSYLDTIFCKTFVIN